MTQTLIVSECSAVPQTRVLMNILELQANETYQHSIRVAERMAKMLAVSGYHADPQFRRDVITGALLHDIGKTVTPFNLSQYPGTLTTYEKEIMKAHALISYEFVKDVFPEPVQKICLLHHAYGDPSGYPTLHDEIVPEYVHWVQAADIYDALTSDRAYRKAMTPIEALSILDADARRGKIRRQSFELLNRSLYDEI